MRLRILVGCICLFLYGCGEDDEDTGGGGELCAQACAARLACPMNSAEPTCVQECQQLSAACPSEAAALQKCTIAQPASSWMCDDFDEAVLADTVCNNEGAAALACALGG